jgi:hypothetical protein
MAYGVEKLDLSWAVGRYGDGSWNAVIEHAEKVAIELMADDEDGDALDWAKGFLLEARHKPHAGDCRECRSWLTVPITCDACVYDKYMTKAWAKMKTEVEAGEGAIKIQPPANNGPAAQNSDGQQI